MIRGLVWALGWDAPAWSARSVEPARAVTGVVPALVVSVVATLSPIAAAGGGTTARQGEPATAAMAGTEDYCAGYEKTFHGEWAAAEAGASGPPVLFRIGANARGAGCYAQLNLATPSEVAPFEHTGFRARERDGAAWTLRDRPVVLEVDTARGTVVRREGRNVTRTGVLLTRPPSVGEPPPTPPAGQRARWYGKWRGRLSRLPLRVTLRFSESRTGEVIGKVSSLLMRQTFMGWFHGDMLIFRWRNRHVGLCMEPDGKAIVYNDYKGRAFRFHRRR